MNNQPCSMPWQYESNMCFNSFHISLSQNQDTIHFWFQFVTVLFCTNSQCSMPSHTIMTEATLCHGGSQELVKILSHVGAAASIDTNQRLAMQVVESQRFRGNFV